MQGLGLCDAVEIKPCGLLKWRLPDLRSVTVGCEVNALAWHTVAVGGRRPLCETALVNIEPYGFQEPMTRCAGDLGLEETMAAATGERAPAFTSEELEKLVDGVLPQYALLYGPPDQQVSAHQKVDIWRAIAKEVRALGVHNRRGTHCRKRWEDIRRGTRKTAESLLGMASQCRRGASRTLTPLMSRILAVAYPDLDGHVRTSQQTQGGEYQHILLSLHAVEASGWGRRAVGDIRPGRFL
ncbi:hypothetical protein NDU88_004497 [Pleurodeles waltl]|uniref:Myb/SANT-like DNA-binding domain-containing protein n=1 Tax=Pleurodeles waltl TaxID=8319 RepID=A0AAV7UJE0_PLEWA|nr:hypothetical protein NDU88_004497 [Pleurodeles waltl]